MASEANGIIIANKIIPHTDSKEDHKNGLLDMPCTGRA